MTTGEAIKKARKSAGITQAELAEKLGISYVGVSQWENNLRKPKIETLRKIANALNVSVYTLADFGQSSAMIADSINRTEVDYGEAAGAVMEIAYYLTNLNEHGRAVAIERVKELSEIPKYQEK